MITNYDLAREIKYLSVITVGQVKNLDDQESRKIAIDSLIKDKIKNSALANYDNIIIKDELINNQIVQSTQNIGFKTMEDFKLYLKFEEYEFDEFKKKILILKVENKRVEENKMDLDKKMKELIEIEKNKQLNNFSTNYFNQVKNNIKIKYFNE